MPRTPCAALAMASIRRGLISNNEDFNVLRCTIIMKLTACRIRNPRFHEPLTRFIVLINSTFIFTVYGTDSRTRQA